MKTTIIIQARVSSTRLPSKVLEKIQGLSIIELIVKRLKKTKFADDIIVAIPNNTENKILKKHLIKKNIRYFCGSEKNVLSRYYFAAKKNNSKIIIRITGDCPIVDPKIVDEFVKNFKKSQVDYLSNTNPWTFPDGFDVEVFSFKLLSEAFKKANKNHIKNGGVLISYLKENKNYKIKNIKCKIRGHFRKIRLTIDEKVDLELVRKLYDKFQPNFLFGLKEVYGMYKKNKNIFKMNSHLKLNEGSNLDKSQKIWRRANSVILGGNSLISKNPNMFLPNKWPTYFSKAKGCQIWDLERRKYTDLSLMGVGTNILGYCNPEVDNSVKRAVNNSTVSSLNCVEEVYLAEKLISLHKWADKVKFARTGGEANALAIRIARASSGKENVAFAAIMVGTIGI